MACKTETREINGHTYSVTQLAAKSALYFQFRLGRALAPGLGRLRNLLGEIDNGKDKDRKETVSTILEAMQDILLSLDTNEAVGIIEYTLTKCHVLRDNTKLCEPGQIDMFYSGNMMEMYKVVLFVWEVNFSDFFGGLGRLTNSSSESPEPEK